MTAESLSLVLIAFGIALSFAAGFCFAMSIKPRDTKPPNTSSEI